MTELVLMATCLTFASIGVLSPFVWSLGYVWVDTLLPHRLSYSILAATPLAFIMGAAAVLSYVIQDRRAPPKISTVHVLCMMIGVWITFTTFFWAILPQQAYLKWDVAVKTVVFTVFMPFVFRTRVQIEALALVFMFSAAGHLLPWGMKTALTGGGYELSLGLMPVNSTVLAESSVVSAVAPMFIPMLLWFRAHSLLVPWIKVRTLIVVPMIVLYLLTTIGTFARTGVLALGVLGAAMFVRSRRKTLFLVIAVVLGGVMFSATSDKWMARISTIDDYKTETSANTRLLVWGWTLKFAVDHPLGGGFNAYMVNVLNGGNNEDGQPVMIYGRAYHNIFFAALGEHGWPGLALYIAILGSSLWNMQRVARLTRDKPEMRWAGDMARAVQLGLAILITGGMFVDISFNSLLWDMIALTLCIYAHVRRVLADERAAAAPSPAYRPLPPGPIGRPQTAFSQTR